MSMSVNSLIDRLREELPNPSHSPHPPSSPRKTPTPKVPSKLPPVPLDKGLLALLGQSVEEFPFSELAFVEAIKLRTEQERTKQDYYKLEIANKNLMIIQAALQSQVPPHLIPQMCVGGQTQSSLERTISQQQNLQPPQYMHQRSPSQSSQSTYAGPSHSRSGSRDFDSLNANPIPPMQYRFGGGSTPLAQPPVLLSRRPLSPAKIGAAAVANLANPTTPYRPAKRTIPLHQRHFSMPVELSRKPAKGMPSPIGLTPQIQVKPLPAQPLHKQLRKPPSQELMTSFQHIIQFHHWKPEYPGQPPSAPVPVPVPGPLHKRHKSDLKEDDETDVTMDTSITSDQDRFPHEILRRKS